MIFLYVWDVKASKWCFAGVKDDKEAALETGRRLWRTGASGVKIIAQEVLVEKKR